VGKKTNDKLRLGGGWGEKTIRRCKQREGKYTMEGREKRGAASGDKAGGLVARGGEKTAMTKLRRQGERKKGEIKERGYWKRGPKRHRREKPSW